MEQKQLADLEIKCRKMPQLRTFVTFKDFGNKPLAVSKPLSFIQRKSLNKLFVSCLELKICTGRYMHQIEAERLCKVSNICTEQSLVESECHFLLACPAYNELRQAWLSKLVLPENFVHLSNPEKLKVFFNIAENLKPSAQYIVDAFNMRSRVLLKL